MDERTSRIITDMRRMGLEAAQIAFAQAFPDAPILMLPCKLEQVHPSELGPAHARYFDAVLRDKKSKKLIKVRRDDMDLTTVLYT
jgi:hypothetical protein